MGCFDYNEKNPGASDDLLSFFIVPQYHSVDSTHDLREAENLPNCCSFPLESLGSIFAVQWFAVKLSKSLQFLPGTYLRTMSIFKHLQLAPGMLSFPADEVARNGAHLRITSARGFLGRPLHFAAPLSNFLSQSQSFPQIKTCPAEQICNYRLLEARRVIFHANELLFFINTKPPDSIDFAHIVNRPHEGFADWIRVAISHFHLRHF